MDITPKLFEERRRILLAAAPAAALTLLGCESTRERADTKTGGGEPDEAEVTPGEDLMQEHGVVERILLVYAEAARRIDHAETLDPALVARTAELVRRFVQDYHEKLEESFVFPKLKAAGREVPLVDVLLAQHARGREVTDDIVRLCRSHPTPALAQRLRDFERMYRPHAAREDTVAFPAFRSLMGRDAYRELGDEFEDEEQARFGKGGFEANVAEIARIENELQIGDLASFTPGT